MSTFRICQSCGTPIKIRGTNRDGSENQDYCRYCFENGQFTSNATMEEMIQHAISIKKELGASKEELDDVFQKYYAQFSELRRWKNKNQLPSGE